MATDVSIQTTMVRNLITVTSIHILTLLKGTFTVELYTEHAQKVYISDT